MIELEKFIPRSFADIIEDMISKNPEFTWTYTPSTNNQKEAGIMRSDERSYESEQFVHALYLEGAKRSPSSTSSSPSAISSKRRPGSC